MKIALLILGIALFIIGIQDGIRILMDNQSTSIFSWMPGGFTVHIALDVALAIGGGLLAKYASQTKLKS